MADSEESVELLFFDTFSHDINEVSSNQMNSNSAIYPHIINIPLCDKKYKSVNRLFESIITT